jgi:hypothetical protein
MASIQQRSRGRLGGAISEVDSPDVASPEAAARSPFQPTTGAAGRRARKHIFWAS